MAYYVPNQNANHRFYQDREAEPRFTQPGAGGPPGGGRGGFGGGYGGGGRGGFGGGGGFGGPPGGGAAGNQLYISNVCSLSFDDSLGITNASSSHTLSAGRT